MVLAGDSGDLNLVIVGESELFAVVCWLSPIILPFLDNVDESILILRSGEYDLVENESDLKNVLGNVPNVEGEPDMLGLCIFNLPPDVVFEALLLELTLIHLRMTPLVTQKRFFCELQVVQKNVHFSVYL